MLGNINPKMGEIYRNNHQSIYIDQDYSLIEQHLKVYEQALMFNHAALQEHEIKTRLNRFLFTKADWDKPCQVLSGGEKMRLMLCCLTIGSRSPDLIILDEPTNNLDIQSSEILVKAMNEYRGTVIVISHDAYFLEQLNLQQVIQL
jgi:ATPase subunit of ABC transporter with duplicated ATPase domains